MCCFHLSDKLNWENFLKYIVPSGAILIIGYLSLDAVLKPFHIFPKYFSDLDLLIAFGVFMVYFIILVYFPYTLLVYYSKVHKKKFNLSLFTVFLIVFAILCGTTIIDYYVSGQADINFPLNDHNQQTIRVGQINCTSSGERLRTNDMVYCKTQPKLYNLTAIFQYTLYDGTIVEENFENLSFVAPENSRRIYFELHGNDLDGKKFDLSVGNDYHFLSDSEHAKRREFVTLFFALFVIALFSIPSMVSNFKDLGEDTRCCNGNRR